MTEDGILSGTWIVWS